jgi:hypothetical protein
VQDLQYVGFQMPTLTIVVRVALAMEMLTAEKQREKGRDLLDRNTVECSDHRMRGC